jgi:hypothetical protein
MAILQIDPSSINSSSSYSFANVSANTFTATGNLQIPTGNTAQRPNSPTNGLMRYNTETGLAEIYTSSGWGVFGSQPPTISTVSPGTYSGESGTEFTINGANFTNDAVVKFVDVNNTEYSAAIVTFVNASQLLATTPQDFTVAQGPLDVKVTQISGTVTKLNCIDTGGSPGWVTTAGQIGGTIYRNGSVSVTVSATDPDSGASVTYSVLSGALPSGLSLNSSTGVISGTAPDVGSDTTYNFTLRATDNAGNTSDRAFSMVILQGAPSAPTIGTATRSASQSVQVTFTAPANVGGSSITSYTVTSSPGSFTGTGATSPITVTGLTNGTAYTFTVTATNSYGTSVASSASNSATPYTVPGAPTIGSATATGSNTATVAFTAPASNGGSTITSYTAVSSPGGITGTLSQAGSGTITVSGLAFGTAYTFTVYATNAAGNGTSSSASNSITTSQLSVEYLVVAGGGSGGSNSSGGGGAGGMLTSTLSVSPSTGYTVTVGGGGAAVNWGSAGNQGSSSTFASITSTGGGYGSGETSGFNGGNGGSGGGGAPSVGTGIAGQGNNGGLSSTDNVSYTTGGGGGGAGAVGGAASGGSGGNGGAGSSSSITGSSVTYAGGGGGGGDQRGSRANGSGGSGGGGNGGTSGSSNPTAGSPNTGGGGGGQGYGSPQTSSINGGSGVVIIAYPSSNPPLSSIGGGLSYDQPTRSGYRVYRFYSGTGTISW